MQPLALDDYDVFKNVFSNPIVASRDPAANGQVKKLGSARAAELADITKRFLLRRVTDDIMTSLLPPRTDYIVFVNMCAEQAVAYKSVIDLLRVESSKSATPSATALSLLQIMRRVCNHPSLLNETGTSDPKLSAAVQLSPEAIRTYSPKLAVLDGILGVRRRCSLSQVPPSRVTLSCRCCQSRSRKDRRCQQQHESS